MKPPYASLGDDVRAAFIRNTRGLFAGRKTVFEEVVVAYTEMIECPDTDDYFEAAVHHLTATDPETTRIVKRKTENEPCGR